MNRLGRLSARDRRALRLGLVVVAPILLFFGCVRPYHTALLHVREQLRVQQDLLARERALLREAETFAGRLVRAEARLETTSPRLFAGDPAVAGGALVGYLSQHAEASRVLIERSETRASERAAEGLAAIRVELSARTDLEGLFTFLDALERGPKLVTVERLGVERVESGRGLSDAAPDVQVLAVRAVVAGYVPTAPVEEDA